MRSCGHESWPWTRTYGRLSHGASRFSSATAAIPSSTGPSCRFLPRCTSRVTSLIPRQKLWNCYIASDRDPSWSRYCRGSRFVSGESEAGEPEGVREGSGRNYRGYAWVGTFVRTSATVRNETICASCIKVTNAASISSVYSIPIPEQSTKPPCSSVLLHRPWTLKPHCPTSTPLPHTVCALSSRRVAIVGISPWPTKVL